MIRGRGQLVTDDTVGADLLEHLLRPGLESLKERELIGRHGVLVRELRDGERPSPIPPDGFGFPKMGKA